MIACTASSMEASKRLTPGRTDIVIDPGLYARTLGTGKRPAHHSNTVLNTLTSRSGQCTYDHAINEFVEWYCSEPRLAFNRTVVLRYRISLEQKQYAPSTINLRLAAVRRVAYEAADSGLLSPELAAGIRRVKGVRRLGLRVGNWLTAEQGKRLLEAQVRIRYAASAIARCFPFSSDVGFDERSCLA